jgi:general secretion pathway protein K
VTNQRGFALLAVMLGLTLLSVIVLEFAFAMRLEASAGHAFKEDRLAAHLAEAAVQQALVEIASAAPIVAMDKTGRLVFHRQGGASTLPEALPVHERARTPLGAGAFAYRITDEEGRLDLNLATPERLRRLLSRLGVDGQMRDVAVDSLEDWKDSNELRHANGAESDDYYLRLPVPYRARNGRLQDVAELRQIRGITPALYEGTGEQPGLAALTTVHGRTAVNINTAPPPVLAALGLPDAGISGIVQSRARTPYGIVPGHLADYGLSVSSTTFRIEAEGWVTEGRKTRVVAIVQRRNPQPSTSRTDGFNALGLAILGWHMETSR